MRGNEALIDGLEALIQIKEEIQDENGHPGGDSGLVIDLFSRAPVIETNEGEIPGGDHYH